MKGIDVHMSQHIGKKLSALFQTLTTLTEDEREVRDDDDEEGGDQGQAAFLEAGVLVASAENSNNNGGAGTDVIASVARLNSPFEEQLPHLQVQMLVKNLCITSFLICFIVGSSHTRAGTTGRFWITDGTQLILVLS